MPWISVPPLADASVVAAFVGASDAAVGVGRHPATPITVPTTAAATVQPSLVRRSLLFMPSP
ncbi:hypothetical protein OG895_09345 [Streptomyces sp. NBC_00201]|uniref:hypothetical protein n=1 Tax=unclassified Streptomyces TaxID=2593676 RepID=UPI00224E0C0D|nr:MULTISPECIES: hypothetical protein [unclassified Streptomyces]MCX5047640.1 hypothetical protein [Streptomyces sp. NBC_00474]MCX5245451.1 hypothetical protein [Streptomyces sp. NBC_00201]MCX5288771.1 hypothetical protein [Streptomyces sp. NBC_00183]